MAWNPFRKTSKYETKSVVLGTSDELGQFLLLGNGQTATTASSAKSLYNSTTAVSSPINYVADPFVDLDLALQNTRTKELTSDHAVLQLLQKPSPFYTSELFRETIAKDYLITGEFSVVALGNVNRPPLELQPIGPEKLTPVREQASDAPTSWIVSGNTLTGSYAGSIKNGLVRYRDGNLREINVTRNYSPRDNSLFRGQSLLVSASKEARTAILGTEHNVSLLENGGRISLVFHFEEDMSDDDFEAIREKIISRYGGAPRAGSVGVTAGGKLQIEELGKTPKDMDFGVLEAFVEKSLAKVYKVPLPLISDNRQSLNNYEIAVLALYDDGVLPLSKRILGGLSELLLPRYGLDTSEWQLVANPDSVTALVKRRNEELLKRRQIGIESDNELRALIGREGYEGGDAVLKPANLVPAGQDVFTDDNDPDKLEDTLGGSDA